jgi:hypothetical protein
MVTRTLEFKATLNTHSHTHTHTHTNTPHTSHHRPIFVDKMSVEKMSVDKMPVDKMSPEKDKMPANICL